jgi:hypothetical protein
MFGSMQSMAHNIIENNATGINKYLLTFLGNLALNLDRYNFRDMIADGGNISYSLAGMAILYGIGYATVALLIASWLFNERQV